MQANETIALVSCKCFTSDKRRQRNMVCDLDGSGFLPLMNCYHSIAPILNITYNIGPCSPLLPALFEVVVSPNTAR
jgi:hypothetical protein